MAKEFALLKQYLNLDQQIELVDNLSELLGEAPFFIPRIPKTGKKFSVEITNLGSLGWVSDKEKGYRYQPTHPVTGKKWPEIPQFLLSLWENLVASTDPPEACLINGYFASSKMGLHKDCDEKDFSVPVMSISLGSSARFRIGGSSRSDPTRSLQLDSGDIVILAGLQPTGVSWDR